MTTGCSKTKAVAARPVMRIGASNRRLSGAAKERRVFALVAASMHAPFVAEFVSASVRVTRQLGCELLAYSLVEPDEELPETVVELLARTAQGVISLLSQDQRYFDVLAAADVPVITVENTRPSRYPNIVCDNYAGARLAVRHLIGLGHRRIAHLAGHPALLSSVDRLRAYQDALREAGLPLERSLLGTGDSSQATAFLVAQRLLATRSSPTAIFAANDASALGILAAAHALGLRVPEELSVIGFDDIPQAAMGYPTLTTVRQPIEDMARSAVEAVMAMLAGTGLPREITLETRLVVRGSTAPPRRVPGDATRREGRGGKASRARMAG